jgi:hypothetical protein
MLSKRCGVLRGVGAVLILITTVIPALGQRQKIAVFVQAAVPVPAAQLEILKSYANQRCSIITGATVCSQGELLYAQRLTNTYIGNSVPLEGMRKIAQTLDADHIIVLRIVRWENQISFKPERSLLLLGVTSFLEGSIQLLTSPLGLIFGLDKEATVGLFATVFSPTGDIEFTTAVTTADRPFLSLLTADPLEAAKEAIENALYQVAVAL